MAGETEGKLNIRLSAETGEVTLSLPGNSDAWQRIRRAVSERTTYSRITRETELQLPWWEFAPILGQLGQILRLHNVDHDVDLLTREYITRSQTAASSFRLAEGVKPIPEAELKEVLAEYGFKRPLKDHQLRNVAKLAALPHGATFSVPGAGKTTEALAAFCYRYRNQKDSRLLVVAPKNAFPAWEEQVSECLDGVSVTRLVGGRASIENRLRENPKLSIIGYSQLPNVTDLVARHLQVGTTAMFLDESHRIKRGEEGTWGNAVLRLSYLPDFKLIMSGTPMPNDVKDLDPQVRFLFPTLSTDEEPAEALRHVYVRTTKAELKLRPPDTKITAVPMNDAQDRLYRLCASDVARQLETALKSADRGVLRSLGRSYMILLELVSNPALLLHHQHRFSNRDLVDCLQSDSPKIAYACHRARTLAAQGHKTIIWSGFVENVETIALRLRDLGADYIHGGVEAGSEEEEETRERKVARFHEDDTAMVLVANPAACSEGISLHTVCHHALYVDRNYNAAQFLQSADRIHRLGLLPDQATNIEILVSPDTIDDSVHRRLETKIANMERVLNDPSISLSPEWQEIDDLPDADDIRDLLSSLNA
jgi:SNF2 family DNA or RNA helicase